MMDIGGVDYIFPLPNMEKVATVHVLMTLTVGQMTFPKQFSEL